MTFIAGQHQLLQVAREVEPFGLFLTDGAQEILLHYTELEGSKPAIGASIEVFIFHDSDDRLCATMKKPLIHLGQVSKLTVADVNPTLGAFLEIGLGRQLLYPASEQSELAELRPRIGDEVYVKVAHDKQGRLVALTATNDDLSPLVYRAPESWKNKWVEGIITKTVRIGSFAIVDGGIGGFGAYGFIPANDRPQPLRVGEKVRARITFVRPDGRVNLSMAALKEVSRLEDADRLLAFLRERPDGAMPYSDDTEADIIKQKFGMSKSMFKRALGKLMREGLIIQEGNWTKLVNKPSDTSELPSSGNE